MNSSNITSGLVFAGLLLAGYLYFFNPSNNIESATALSAGNPSSSAEQTFINLAGELDPISFPTGIFSDPAFMSFTDTRTAITPENAGRPDPFAPLSGIGGR